MTEIDQFRWMSAQPRRSTSSLADFKYKPWRMFTFEPKFSSVRELMEQDALAPQPDDLLKAFRAKADSEGTGYQTLINQTLRQAVGAAPVDEATLRRVLREELKAG